MTTKTACRRLMVALALLVPACTSAPKSIPPGPVVDCTQDPTNAACTCQVDPDCKSAAMSRCDVASGQCVPCLPGATDNCAFGQVCRGSSPTFACVSVCSSNGDCAKLKDDPSFQCCGGICVAEATDGDNCGACGHKCDAVANGTAGCAGGYCIVSHCDDGFADCNQAIVDGCEVATASDPSNCSACGMACKPEVNGVPVCTNGACLTSCAAGYLDCNNDATDGCEIGSNYDSANCGGCAKSCSAPAHADAACDQGKCGFRCKRGYSDCNNNPPDGCETSVLADVANCGHCGNVCPVNLNAVGATCSGGLCGNDCVVGFGDCDGSERNGCESDTTVDMANCGACGTVCSSANTLKASCAMGVCTITCRKGFEDCNMDTSDGCEAALANDPMNCGGCGSACPMDNPFCNKSVCTNVFPAPAACVNGTDPELDGTFTVCAGADQDQAWFGTNRGRFHVDQICSDYLYVSSDQYGNSGTFNGQCQDQGNAFGGHTCNNPQDAPFFDGCPNFGGCQVAGNDGFGLILQGQVMWTCLR